MTETIAEARAWIAGDLLAAQRVLAAADLPREVPAHVEVLTDILDDRRHTLDWKLTVAAAILAARDASTS